MSTPPDQIQEIAKTAMDATAVGVAGLAWLSVLPHVAALLSIIWLGLRIYESETVQKLFGHSHGRKK
jgi:hypothetical protein